MSTGHGRIPSRTATEQVSGHLAAKALSLGRRTACAPAKRSSPVGCDDNAYEWETAKYGALSPKKAMDNADSYAHFAWDASKP